MKIFYKFLLILIIIPAVFAQNELYFNLTAEDKNFLMNLLPKDHKLSVPMQKLLMESRFELPDERTKRQYVFFRPETYAPVPQPFEMNLPVITPTMQPPYVFVGPRMLNPSDLSYLQPPRKPPYSQVLPFDDFKYNQFTTESPYRGDSDFYKMLTPCTQFDLVQMVNRAAQDALESKQYIRPLFHDQVTLPTMHLVPIPETSYMKPAHAAKLDDFLHVTGHVQATESTEQLTKPSGSNGITARRQVTLSSRSRSAEISAGVQPAPPAPAPAIAGIPTNMPDPNIQLTPSTQAHIVMDVNKADCIALQDECNKAITPANQSVSEDAQVKEKLESILEGVETLKTMKQPLKVNEGLPCSVIGKWESESAGVGLNIDKEVGIDFNVPVFQTSNGTGFLNKSMDWRITGSFPGDNIGLLVLTATRCADYTMATFTGECRTCDKEELIIGHWLFVKPAADFHEMNRASDFFGDTWKRQQPSSCE